MATAPHHGHQIHSACPTRNPPPTHTRTLTLPPCPPFLHTTFRVQVFQLRAMLAVPYFEKALYEMPEEQLSVDSVLALADRIESEIQVGRVCKHPSPLLTRVGDPGLPHMLISCPHMLITCPHDLEI
eukprot:357281-Chlamydomonas_euryale.AAC.35